MVVFGDFDAEGNPHPDNREGLRANLDALAAAMRPGGGTLAVVMPDGSSRTGNAISAGGLQATALGPGAMRAVVDLIIPEGVLRSTSATTATSASVSGGSSGTISIANSGTAEQNAVVYTLSGTATSVVLTNTSHPDTPTLTVAVNLASGNVVVNTGAYTALQGTTSKLGNITPTKTQVWLPLILGANNISIAPTGGSCTLSISHYPAFL
jgi:hypothetical protein